MHIRGWSHPLALFGTKETSRIIFAVRLAHTTPICSLAHDGRIMPSTSSTVAVVETQRRGDRGHGGPPSLKGESPFVCISQGGATLSPCLAQKKPVESSFTLRLYACWLATAVPRRQRAAQSPLWSYNGGATAATMGRGRSRESHPSYAYQKAEPPTRPVWRKYTSSIVFIVHLAHDASICSLARDGRTTPSASSTASVVESQRRGDRGHGGQRSLTGESPFGCISEGGATLPLCLARRYF